MRVRVTLANWPGHSRFSVLGKLALRRTVPVVGSMALSTKVTTPRSGFFSPEGKASTLSDPACMYFLISPSCCWGTVKET